MASSQRVNRSIGRGVVEQQGAVEDQAKALRARAVILPSCPAIGEGTNVAAEAPGTCGRFSRPGLLGGS
jgi:hypothetical protein